MILYILALVLSTGSPLPQEDYTTVVTYPDGCTVTCTLADSPMERWTGLSQHESLPRGKGMLFVYPESRMTSFWMPPSMKFNIDIVFLDVHKSVIHIAHNAPPCNDPQGIGCPSYSPESRVMYVLEIPAGEAAAHNLVTGSSLKITFPQNYERPTM
jgi:uncharacterized membrane protein (UPF0127 family)